MAENTNQVRYAFPKYRVFVFGVEVTDDTVGVTVTSHDGDAPNTCSITLLNEFDKYVLTTNDIALLNGIPNGQLNIPWLKKKKAINQDSGGALFTGSNETISNIKYIQNERKRSILAAKGRVVQRIDASQRRDPYDAPVDETNLTGYYGARLHGYPISDGAAVFHSMDPVRVFMRDPFDPSRWYWHFTGFLSDVVDNTDENNVKQITLVVEDPTKLFRYTRAAMNPGILDANLVVMKEDLRVRSFYVNPFRDLYISELFFTLFFGPDKAGTEKILQKAVSASGGSNNLDTSLRGIGHFAFDSSSCFTLGEDQSVEDQERAGVVDVKLSQRINSLESWQGLIDHEVQPSDLFTMATQADRETQSAITIISRGDSIIKRADGRLDIDSLITYVGTHPEQYLVDGGRLMMLLPGNLGSKNAQTTEKAITSSGAPMQSEWSAVGEIMKEAVDRIQYIMYSSPKGDIIIEPPLFDFDPDDFGLERMAGDSFVSQLPPSSVDKPNSIDILSRGEQLFPGYERGGYGLNYIILKRDTHRLEGAQVDSKVYTAAVCAHSIVQNWSSIPNTSIVGDLAVVTVPELIPLYGIRPATITAPGYIATAEAAAYFANTTLNKLNADSHTANVQHVPNIQLWLNRPIYIEHRNFIGTTKQITHSITWGANGSMETSSDLYTIRTWQGLVSSADPTQPIYTSIGGYGSRPLNYAVLFKSAPKPLQKEEGFEPDWQASTQSYVGTADAGSDKINKARNSIPIPLKVD